MTKWLKNIISFISNINIDISDITTIIIACIIIIILLISIPKIYRFKVKYNIRRDIKKLANNTLEITPKQFFKIRNKTFGGQGQPLYANKYTFEGIYILYNKTKKRYYVGQAKKVIDRVNKHLTGSGNGDVYADFKYGDTWTIRMIDIKNTHYTSLNELERKMIKHYNAYTRGYNRTKGNKN